MVMWNPSGTTLIFRPHVWHTTLVRANPASRWSSPNLAFIQACLNHALMAMTAGLRQPNGWLRELLTMPPWRQSYNFGVPRNFAQMCEALMHMAESMLLAEDSRITILERREHHISWNN